MNHVCYFNQSKENPKLEAFVFSGVFSRITFFVKFLWEIRTLSTSLVNDTCKTHETNIKFRETANARHAEACLCQISFKLMTEIWRLAISFLATVIEHEEETFKQSRICRKFEEKNLLRRSLTVSTDVKSFQMTAIPTLLESSLSL